MLGGDEDKWLNEALGKLDALQLLLLLLFRTKLVGEPLKLE